MASIQRRKSGYQVQVRRQGFPVASGMFESRKEAEAWAREIESEMDRGIHVSRKEAESTTLLEALDRYEIEITSTKRGAPRERYRIAHWRKQPLACRYLASIRSQDVAQYRDGRGWLRSAQLRRYGLNWGCCHTYSPSPSRNGAWKGCEIRLPRSVCPSHPLAVTGASMQVERSSQTNWKPSSPQPHQRSCRPSFGWLSRLPCDGVKSSG